MDLFTSAHWGLRGLTLTCILSFFFNEMVTRINPESFHLRSHDLVRKTTPPLITDFDPAPLLTNGLNEDPSGGFDVELIDDNIPACAREVFLKLREESTHETSDDDQGACRGMLIRDDIILTSRKCSRLRFDFDFPDEIVGTRFAKPLNLKDEKMRLVDPRLGFLKADSPPHYHFVDKPVMRTRMFLSRESHPGIDDFEDGAVILTCSDGGKPVAHNFPVDGELVPLAHLSSVVPEDILWIERDIDAPMLKLEREPVDGNDSNSNPPRWWTRRIARKEEEKTIKSLLASYDGPNGSVSIPKAHEGAFVSQVGGLCEAIDPRGHRRQDCFKNYFFRWQKADPFSGTHFFDWLDYGEGKHLLEVNDTRKMIIHVESDLKCLKIDFDRKKVHYFDRAERLAHEVELAPSEDGREVIARYKQSGEPVPENREEKSHLYTWGLDGTLYVVDHTWDKDRYGQIKHTAVLAGGPALSAGKAYFGKHGRLAGVNWSSGHYRPDVPALSLMYQWMKDEGLNVTALDWIGRTQWSTENCRAYDWSSVEVPGYEPAELNRSCHEVTTGPTWRLKEDDR